MFVWRRSNAMGNSPLCAIEDDGVDQIEVVEWVVAVTVWGKKPFVEPMKTPQEYVDRPEGCCRPIKSVAANWIEKYPECDLSSQNEDH